MRLALQLALGLLAEPMCSLLHAPSAVSSLVANLLQANAVLVHPAKMLSSRYTGFCCGSGVHNQHVSVHDFATLALGVASRRKEGGAPWPTPPPC